MFVITDGIFNDLLAYLERSYSTNNISITETPLLLDLTMTMTCYYDSYVIPILFQVSNYVIMLMMFETAETSRGRPFVN